MNPAEIAIDGDIGSPRVQEAIAKLQQSLADDPAFPLPAMVVANPAGDLALMSVVIPGEPSGRAAVAAMATLRERHIPAAFDGVPAEVFVGGVTAITADLFDIVARYTPIVFAFVLGLSFLILLLVFRSIVIPVKAVVMNLLSVGAAYGLLALVFQKGVATNLLGFRHAEVIDAWIPLFLFTILFGLSMDYHVFLLSRIRERYDQTGDNGEAVAYGAAGNGGHHHRRRAHHGGGVRRLRRRGKPSSTSRWALAWRWPYCWTLPWCGRRWCRPAWSCWAGPTGICRRGSIGCPTCA